MRTYRIVIEPSADGREWHMALYHTVPGQPDQIVRHERTDRVYRAPEDCCTSARHLIKEIEKEARS